MKKSGLKKPLVLLSIAVAVVLIGASCMENIAYVVTGEVTKVTDGNTFELVTEVGNRLQIRLYGIETPETFPVRRPGEVLLTAHNHYGLAALKALETKILEEPVYVGVIRMEGQNRLLGIVWFKDRNINLEMLREGHCDVLTRELKPPHRAKFMVARNEAKAAGRGIWSAPEYKRLVFFVSDRKAAQGKRRVKHTVHAPYFPACRAADPAHVDIYCFIIILSS